MARLRFTPSVAHPTWKHRVGGAYESTYAGKPTLRLRGPEILKGGDEVDMDAFDAQWATVHLPDNFALVQDEEEDAVEVAATEDGEA